MVELLERIAEKEDSVDASAKKDYLGRIEYSGASVSRDSSYSTFAEMYLEKPIDVQAGLTCSMCTWRGVPTIDDW
jgi:hypothetical protein